MKMNATQSVSNECPSVLGCHRQMAISHFNRGRIFEKAGRSGIVSGLRMAGLGHTLFAIRHFTEAKDDFDKAILHYNEAESLRDSTEKLRGKISRKRLGLLNHDYKYVEHQLSVLGAEMKRRFSMQNPP